LRLIFSDLIENANVKRQGLLAESKLVDFLNSPLLLLPLDETAKFPHTTVRAIDYTREY